MSATPSPALDGQSKGIAKRKQHNVGMAATGRELGREGAGIGLDIPFGQRSII